MQNIRNFWNMGNGYKETVLELRYCPPIASPHSTQSAFHNNLHLILIFLLRRPFLISTPTDSARCPLLHNSSEDYHIRWRLSAARVSLGPVSGAEPPGRSGEPRKVTEESSLHQARRTTADINRRHKTDTAVTTKTAVTTEKSADIKIWPGVL